MTHLERFLKDNPHYKKLKDATAEQQEALIQAKEKGYIFLTRAPMGTLCYTSSALEQALMWKDKGCLED